MIAELLLKKPLILFTSFDIFIPKREPYVSKQDGIKRDIKKDNKDVDKYFWQQLKPHRVSRVPHKPSMAVYKTI
jgi:hypothetical protein